MKKLCYPSGMLSYVHQCILPTMTLYSRNISYLILSYDDEYHGDDDLFERCTVETESVEVKPQIDVAHDRHNGPKVDQHLKILLSISDI